MFNLLKALNHFNKTGEVIAMDSMPAGGLDAHDRKYHPGGYKEGDHCQYRENLKKDDKADTEITGNETASAPNTQSKPSRTPPKQGPDADWHTADKIRELAKDGLKSRLADTVQGLFPEKLQFSLEPLEDGNFGLHIKGDDNWRREFSEDDWKDVLKELQKSFSDVDEIGSDYDSDQMQFVIGKDNVYPWKQNKNSEETQNTNQQSTPDDKKTNDLEQKKHDFYERFRKRSEGRGNQEFGDMYTHNEEEKIADYDPSDPPPEYPGRKDGMIGMLMNDEMSERLNQYSRDYAAWSKRHPKWADYLSSKKREFAPWRH